MVLYIMTIYTVLFKSSTRVAGSTTTNAFYNISWENMLPANTAFNVRFTFLSNTVNITSLTAPVQILMGIGQHHAYRMNTVSSSTVSTNLLGFLVPPQLSTTTFLQADNATNNPIYIDQRPTNNNVQLMITSTVFPFPDWTDNVGATIGVYDLVLTFEPVEQDHTPLH